MSVSSSAFASSSTDLRSGCGRLATPVEPSRLSVKPSFTPCAIGALVPPVNYVVLRDQLRVVPDALEFDDLAAQHHAAVHALLADAAAQVGREQVGHAELLGRDLDPDLFVFLPDGEQARVLLRLLDHFQEWLLAGRRGRGRACRLRDTGGGRARTRTRGISRGHARRHRGGDLRGIGRRLRGSLRAGASGAPRRGRAAAEQHAGEGEHKDGANPRTVAARVE